MVEAHEGRHTEDQGPAGPPQIRVGGARMSRDAAHRWVSDYLSGTEIWAYPAYDGYQNGRDPNDLTDADLLAPILLTSTI
jgi:hypothetical protein